MFFSLRKKAWGLLVTGLALLMWLNAAKLHATELRGQVSVSGGRYSAFYGGLIDPTALLSTQADLDVIEVLPELDLRLSFEAASNAADPWDQSGIKQNSAQLLMGYARYAPFGDKLVLQLGRHSLYGGGASLASAGLVIDGLSARYRLPAGFRGRAFVGSLSSPLLVQALGDLAAGGQLLWAPPRLPMSLVLQGLYSADPFEQMAPTQTLIGVAGDARPAPYLRVALQSSFDALMLEVAEVHASFTGNLDERWQAGLSLGRVMPSAFIRKSSMFASFSLHSYDELRLSLGYGAWRQLRGQGMVAVQRDKDGVVSGSGQLRAIFVGPSGMTGLAELGYTGARPQGFVGPSRLIQEFNSGFASFVMSLGMPLGAELMGVSWMQLLIFDQPIYDQILAADAGLSLERKLWQELSLQAYVSLAYHPLAGLDPRALMQLRYRFDLRSALPSLIGGGP